LFDASRGMRGGTIGDQAHPAVDHAMTLKLHLHQIAYSAATRAQIPPGWLLLDNSENPRPDWFEYWPIRQYLQTQPLEEAAYYAFFSPKFGAKTQLSLADVQAFVHAHTAETDVFLFSPQPDMGAFFLNVFEQGEAFDAGLIDAYSAFLDHIGRPAPLRALVMDSRQIVFSNYFIARPAFWREWLALNEPLFAICEGPGQGPEAALKAGLMASTSYAGPNGAAQRKVFLMERAASLILATQPQWRSRAYNPYGFGWSLSRFREHPTEAYISDALKMAWRDQRYPQYMQAYLAVRERFRQGTLPR
jgi:hypothetical protein